MSAARKPFTVKAADKAARVVVGRDIGRVLGQNVTDDLIYRVVALLFQSVVNRHEYAFYLTLAVVTQAESHSFVLHKSSPFRSSFFSLVLYMLHQKARLFKLFLLIYSLNFCYEIVKVARR